jgi:nucleoid-associated protein YgaU
MTREHKLALLIGFSLVLVVGIVVSDHFSGARTSQLADVWNPAEPEPTPVEELITTSYQPLSQQLPPDGPQVELPQVDPATQQAGATPTGGGLIDQAKEFAIEMGNGIKHAEPAVGLDRSPQGNGKDAEPTSATDQPKPEVAAPPAIDESIKPLIKSGVAYPIHRVQAGDTLIKIARQHYGDASLVPALKKVNAKRIAADGTIMVGASILIPPKEVLQGGQAPASAAPAGTPTTTAASPAARPSEPLKSPEKKPAARTYTVQKGDTLAVISQKTLGTSKRWREILDLNKGVIDDEDTLFVGLKLKIPAK